MFRINDLRLKLSQGKTEVAIWTHHIQLIMSDYVVALTTCPKDKSDKLALSLVEEKVCACVNIVTSVKSIYHWKDEVVTAEESLLIMKTQQDRKEDLWEAIKRMHPYEVPEFVVLSIDSGSQDYLDWISASIS